MSIASIHKYAVDLNADTVRDSLRKPLGQSNAQAQTFALEVTQGGEYVTLTGASCTGHFIRTDGTTVLISGTVSGNIALVTLPAACYAVPGRCKLSVNLSQSGTIHTLLMVEGYVERTRTDETVDPGSVIPSIDDLLAQISAMETATTAANTAAARAEEAANSLKPGPIVNSWATIKGIVAAGQGPAYFPVGTQLQVNHSVYGTRLFDVVAHDYLKKVDAPDAHTMTIMQHDLLTGTQFDSPEAVYYAETQLAAGTYNITIAGNDKWVAGTYQFTLTSPVPAGGQICVSGQYPYQGNITAASIKTYSSRTTTTPIETATITAGSGGTSLGTCGEGVLNHTHRIAYGSNNYKESPMRQLLNSSAAAGSVWTPQTKFDRPPFWVKTLAGYKAGLEQDFLAVVCPVTLPCAANNSYEAPDSTTIKNTKYTLNDEFYLASRKEVFGSSDDVADDTTVLPYYDGATAADRIKYRDGSAALWWLRTPCAWNANAVRPVNSGGALYNYNASSGCGLAPACTIG